MAEDISTLVLQVKSDGIKEGTNQLDALTKAADKAEASTKKLGTTTAAANVENKSATATAQAQIDAINGVTKATEKSAVASAQAAIQRKRDIETAKDSQISYMQAQEEAIKMNGKITDSLNNVTKGHGSNSAAIRESMVLMHELSQGQMKRLGGSLMVLANQLDVIPKLLSFISTSSISTIASVGAMALGIGAVVAALVALPVALIAGAAEQRKMNVALAETGNFAGLTTTGMENLAKQAVETGGSIGVATDAVIALTASGKFAAPAILSIATAITKTSEAGMAASEDLIKEFEQLATMAVTSSSRSNDVITKHVLGMNDKYHILNLTQLEHISLLEKTGDAAGAAAEAEKLMSEGMTERANEMIEKQGYLVKGWHAVTEAIGGVWSAMKDLGKEEDTSASAQIQHLVELREATRKHAEAFGIDETESIKGFNVKILSLMAAAKQEQAGLQATTDDKLLDQRQQHISRQLESEFRANDEMKKAKGDLAEFNKRIGVMGVEYEKTHTTEILKERKRLEDAVAGIKVDKTGDAPKLRRDQNLTSLELEKKDNLEALEEMLNTSKALGEEETGTRKAQLEDRKAIYEAERINIQVAYDKELVALNTYHGKTLAAIQDNERKKDEIRSAAEAARRNLDKRENADVNSITRRETKDQEELAKKVQTTGDAEVNRLQKTLEADQNTLEGLTKTKSAVDALKLSRDEAAVSAVEQSNEMLRAELDVAEAAGGSKEEIALLNIKLALGVKELGILKETAKVRSQIAVERKKHEAEDRTTKNLDEALASAKRFQKGMSDAFGSVGKGLGDIAIAFAQYGKDQDTAQRKYNDSIKDGVDLKAKEATLNAEMAQAQITGYGNAAEAAKGMFATNSRGYQTMAAVSKVFHVAEAAMQAARMIQLGITAVLTQAQGDPYTAFARMAAMAAVVVGLGVALTGGGSGGGQSAADAQKAQGTGSVFGDTTAKTASITKALDQVQANTGVLIPINNAMLDSLRAIQASMVGLTNLIVRVPGLTQGTNLGVQTGVLKSGTDTFNDLREKVGGIGGAIVGGYFGGPLGALLGNSIGKAFGNLASTIINKMDPLTTKLESLWGKTTQNIVDSGIQLQGAVKNLQSGKGIEQYASVDTTKSSFFGLSKSTSNQVVTQGLSDELNQQFGLIFSNVEDVLKAAAPALGKSSEEVGKAVENYTIPLTKLSLKDLKGDDLTNAINGVISKALDDVAKEALPGYEKFAKVGEGYSQTLVRVANDVLNVQQVFDLLGKTLDITSTNAADISESLIIAAGGLDKLQSATKAFTDGFFTDAEKLAPLQLAVQKRMAELGESSITTADQFKALVLSQDLTTAAGQDMYLKLLDIAPAFKAVQDSADKLAQALKDKLQKAFDDAMSSSTGAASALQASVSKDKSAADAKLTSDKAISDKAHQTALDNIKAQGKAQLDASKAYFDAQKKANADDLKAAQDKVNATQKLLDSIKTSLAATAQYDLAEAHAKALATVQAAAKSGDSANFAGIDDAIKELAKPTEQLFGTLLEYQTSQAQANNALQNLSDAGTSQLTDAQKQLDALALLKDSLDASSQAAQDAIQAQTQQQEDAENARYQSEQDAMQARHDAQIQVLDDILNNAQKQIDLLTGIDTSIKSLSDALHSFATAAAAAGAANAANVAGGATTGGGSATSATAAQTPTGFVENLYGTILGRHSEQAGLDFWTNALKSGTSQAQVISDFYNSPEYQGMHPSLDVGTNEVPDDMLANIHKGERIIPAADNAELMRRIKSNDSDPNADVTTMNNKIDNLIDVVMRGDIANVQKTNDMYRIFRDWDGNGMPPTRS